MVRSQAFGQTRVMVVQQASLPKERPTKVRVAVVPKSVGFKKH